MTGRFDSRTVPESVGVWSPLEVIEETSNLVATGNGCFLMYVCKDKVWIIMGLENMMCVDFKVSPCVWLWCVCEVSMCVDNVGMCTCVDNVCMCVDKMCVDYS